MNETRKFFFHDFNNFVSFTLWTLFGDLIGYQQSGIKNFRFAHPVIHEDLFKLAENFIKNDSIKFNQEKYSFLLKLFDKAEIINLEDY